MRKILMASSTSDLIRSVFTGLYVLSLSGCMSSDGGMAWEKVSESIIGSIEPSIVSSPVPSSSPTATPTPTVTTPASGQFSVVFPGGGTTTAGVAIDVQVIAQDLSGNTNPSYVGSIQFLASDTAATFGGPYSFTAADNGVKTLSAAVTLRSSGAQTVTVRDTNSNQGSESIVVSAVSAVRFRIQAPATSVVNTPANVIIEAIDSFGNRDAGYSGSVRLNASGTSVQGAGTVNLSNGVVVRPINTSAIQTVNLSLTDIASTGLDVSSTASINFTSNPATRFRLTGPSNASPGDCNSFSVTTRDSAGNIAPVSVAITATLSGGGSGLFYAGASCTGGSVTSLTIPVGSSSASFTYRNNTPQPLGITVSDSGSLLNLAPAISQLVIADNLTVASGKDHSCALKNGGVQCWGMNWQGQLGNGTLTRSTSPVQVSNLTSGVTAISSGTDHTCALLSNGSIWCWGNNFYGQLGNGSATSSLTTPVQAVASGATAVSASETHTCAVVNGAAKCWGYNYYGQLGDGTGSTSRAPVDVTGLSSGVNGIATGAHHSCAIVSGRAWCWGNNSSGQLGNVNVTSTSYIPVAVQSPLPQSGLAAIRGGQLHSCALMNSGDIWCWGSNSSGRLGIGGTTSQTAPVQVTSLGGGATSLSLSHISNHSCAVVSGSIRCWGQNAVAQAGVASLAQVTSPTTVSNISAMTSVSVGANHTCAAGAGQIHCWGNNPYGPLSSQYDQTGTLTAGHHTWGLTPVQVAGITSGATSIASGSSHSCAVVSGSVYCWGSNSSGQLGNGALLSFGSCSGCSSNAPLPVSSLTSTVASVAAGHSHTCALTTDGYVYCWGQNTSGQLGDGTSGSSAGKSTPVQVMLSAADGGTALSNVKAITAGGGSTSSSHTCALLHTDRVFCWGYNYFGQLGDNSKTVKRNPSQVVEMVNSVPTPITAFAISAGGTHTCAIVGTGPSGSVYCWGSSSQLGNGSSSESSTATSATSVSTDAISISAGTSYTCIVRSTGATQCWGYGYSGELSPNTGVASVAAGLESTCIIKSATDSVQCHGKGDSGQLGNSLAVSTANAVQVSGLTSNATQLSVGSTHACAIIGGGIKCWGSNSAGQLGAGYMSYTATPVLVPLF